MILSRKLSANVYAAAVDDRCVFIDLNRDAYSSVALRRVERSPGDAEIFARLEKMGLVDPDPCPRAGSSLTSRPKPVSALASNWGARRPHTGDVMRLVMSGLWADRALHRPILQLVSHVREARRPASGEQVLADKVVGFQAVRSWYPRDELCLFDALMLWRWLAGAGHGATWIFGARVRPFLAHCWLESEDGVALNEDLDRVRQFTPILAV